MHHCPAWQCWIIARRVSKPTETEQALRRAAQQRQARTTGWAERRLSRVGEEQLAIRQRAEAIDADEVLLAKWNRAARKDWGHKQAGTVQTHAHAAQLRQGALARLYQSGGIDIHQLGAAQEIAAVAATIGAGLGVRMVSLETRVDGGRRGPDHFWESLGRVRAEWAYGRWRAMLPRPGLVLAMVVEDCGLTAAARQFGMRKVRARGFLVDALDLWPDAIGEARDRVSEADLLAAQAGLAS